MAPRFLLLETSSRSPLVAVAEGDEVRAARRLDESRRNARDLAPTVADLLREQGWSPREITAVVVGLGPGSYTGLRVGVMSAKTFAYATGCGLVGVETFAVLARQAGRDRVDVLADAQKDQVYAQGFRGGVPVGELRIVKVDDWLAVRDAEAWATGPGLVKVKAELPRCPVEAWLPGAAALLAVGRELYDAGRRDDPFRLVPLYLRASAAEQQWDARKG